MRSLPLDELPAHSEWAAYLLGGADEPPRDPGAFTGTETYERIYSNVLDAYREDPAPPAEFYRRTRARGRSDPDVISLSEELFLAGTAELVALENAAVRDVLAPVLDGGETVFDLGCGYGWTLGAIADAFPDTTVVGGEYSPAGVDLARAVYADADRVTVEQFDLLGDWAMLDDGDPDDRDAVVFTKGAFVTLPELAPAVERLDALADSGGVVAGVHLEQVGPHPDTVLGLLREQYSRERGYSDTLRRHLDDAPSLRVTDVTYDVLGDNPLHPLTAIRWTAD